MSVKGLLEAEKLEKKIQNDISRSLKAQQKELKQEIQKIELLLADKDQLLRWRNSPVDSARVAQLTQLMDETERLFLRAGDSNAARIFKARMQKQLQTRLNNLKANELEVKIRTEQLRAQTQNRMLNGFTEIKQDSALREMYAESRASGGFLDGRFAGKFGRSYLQDLVTLETKAAGSKTIGKYMENLYNQYEQGLKDVFVKGIVRGDGFKKMEENLQRTTDITAGKAKLLVRTESNAIMNDSVKAVMDTNPLVKGYRFRAVLDRRTSDICQKHDGEYIPKDKVKPGVNYPPLHPNCRSTVTTVLMNENERKDTTQRYTKNGSNQWIPVPPGITYSKYKDMVLDNVSAVPARKVNIDNIPTLKNLPEAIKTLAEKRAERRVERNFHPVPPEVDINEFVSSKLKPVIDNASLRIRVPRREILNAILDDSRFKSQLEVEASRGIFDPHLRESISETLFGYEKGDVKAEEYEIYGYLSDDMKYDISDGNLSPYGGIIVELNKEKMKDRTTFCIGDSLEGVIYGNELVDDPKVREKYYKGMGENIPPRPDAALRPCKLDDIQETVLSDSNIRKLYFLGKDKEHKTLKDLKDSIQFGYIEAQYHGGVSVSDIDSVTFVKELEVSEELFNKIKSKGIKVKAEVYVKEGLFTTLKVKEFDTYEEYIEQER